MNRVPAIRSVCENAVALCTPAVIEAASRRLDVDLGVWTGIHTTLMALHADGKIGSNELTDLCHYLGMDDVQFNAQSYAVKFMVMRFTTGDLLPTIEAAAA